MTPLNRQQPVLSAAGFRVTSNQTAKSHASYAHLPPYVVSRLIKGNHISYAYPDPQQGVVYLGGEKEYQRFQELTIQRNIAQDHYDAARMQQSPFVYMGYPYPRYSYAHPYLFY